MPSIIRSLAGYACKEQLVGIGLIYKLCSSASVSLRGLAAVRYKVEIPSKYRLFRYRTAKKLRKRGWVGSVPIEVDYNSTVDFELK